MIDEVFKLKLISVKDCFLHFSFGILQKLSANSSSSCVKLKQDYLKSALYFTWSPQYHGGLSDNTVGISAVYANHLGLSDNEIVIISTELQAPVVKTVHVTAVTEDDFEVMCVSQNELQSSMLDQVRVVSIGQRMTVWYSKSLHCSLFVNAMEPSVKIGRLEKLTDIVVSPTLGALQSSENEKNKDLTTKDCLEKPSTYSIGNESEKYKVTDDTDFCSKLNEVIKMKKHLRVFRVIIIKDENVSCCDTLHDCLRHPYNAFTNRDALSQLANKFVAENSAVVCYMRKVLDTFNKETYSKESSSEIYVRLYEIQKNCTVIPFVKNGCNWKNQTLYVSDAVAKLMSLRTGSKVKLKMFNPCLDVKMTHIKLSIISNTLDEDEVVSWFRDELSVCGNILINNNAPFPVRSVTGSVENVMVSLLPTKIPCWPFCSAELKTCQLTVAYQNDGDCDKSNNEIDESTTEEADSDKESSNRINENVAQIPIMSLSRTLSDIVKEGLISFDQCLKLSSSIVPEDVPVKLYNNVLCVGSGAHILSEWLSNSLTGPPHKVYVSKVDCRSLKGKKGDNIQKFLLERLQKCIYYQPSLLVLLDIDAIAGVPNQPENKAEEIFLQGMCRMIRDIVFENQSNHLIGILATAQSSNSVNPEILGPRGYHLFPTLLQIPTLSKADRITIIKDIINRKLMINQISDANFEEFSMKIDGYSYEDLLLLVDKAFFYAWQRKVTKERNKELNLTLDDLMLALDSHIPAHLRSINLYKSSNHSWKTIGGMKTLKENLTEIIIWPSKFGEIYEQCPLRSESGVLLYGVPGTGKTLLASALAGEAGLNFISVKGPELLSKYIGASEEAVRNVFAKAKKAKPCILFFDEFDSLAPRRGHDSSGVMDRVVNQLLTQMDGVEERKGVYVLAATSRPDLLDPALLRPGRIGHMLHCPLPDMDDRQAIIKVLSHHLVLDSGCDFSFIAAQTDGFSGADLQALIYGAQMISYDELNGNDVQSEEDSDDLSMLAKTEVPGKLTIKNSHLLLALKETKPSLNIEELRRYQRIYDNFQKLRCKNNQGENLSVEMKQKITLA
ncbi:peroxisomal biogenesis factor 1 [Lycorma delicatula]|uniref:peroxisomal biogenesis factor 1 n=1 Tax=Lycorma delicatula TaxID=130591 RepID=UPI003F513E5B